MSSQLKRKKVCHLQIVAVILTNTGIALLAYMDGLKGSTTLGGVVLAAASAAASAAYKVAYKRVLGAGLPSGTGTAAAPPERGGDSNLTNCQLAITFTAMSFCGNLLLWPLILLLHFTGVGETGRVHILKSTVLSIRFV